MFTVYAMIQFKHFKLEDNTGLNPQTAPISLFKKRTAEAKTISLPADHFDIPSGYLKYTPRILDDAQDQMLRREHPKERIDRENSEKFQYSDVNQNEDDDGDDDDDDGDNDENNHQWL
jgi:hypothetical protein